MRSSPSVPDIAIGNGPPQPPPFKLRVPQEPLPPPPPPPPAPREEPSYGELTRDVDAVLAFQDEQRVQLERRNTTVKCYECHPKREVPHFPPHATREQIADEFNRRFDSAAKEKSPPLRGALADRWAESLANSGGADAEKISDQFRLREAARLRTANLPEQADALVARPLTPEQDKFLREVEKTPADQLSKRDSDMALDLVKRHRPADREAYKQKPAPQPEPQLRALGNTQSCIDCHPKQNTFARPAPALRFEPRPFEKPATAAEQYAQRMQNLEDKVAPKSAALKREYEKNGWSEDSPYYGVDRAAFLQDVNAKDPAKVSRYDAFRALNEVEGFRKANPKVFEGSGERSKDYYYANSDEMKAAGLGEKEITARQKALAEDPKNPIPYLKKPMAELDGAGQDAVTRDYTRWGVERLESRMRNQAINGVGKEVDRLDGHFNRMLSEQGIVGAPANWIKNNWGSPEGWVADSNLGSNAVAKTIGEAYGAKRSVEELRDFKGSAAEFQKAYQERVKNLGDKIGAVNSHVDKFQTSQDRWVEAVSDIASVSAAIGGAALAPVTGGASLAVGAGIGAMVKVGVKGVDALTGSGEYRGDITVDALKGGLNGASAIGSGALAKAAGERLLASATAKLATGEAVPMLTRAGIWSASKIGEGAVDGYVSQGGGALIEGKSLAEANLDGLRGAAFGAVLNPLASGAAEGLGQLWKRARAPGAPVPVRRGTVPDATPPSPPPGPKISPTPGIADEAAVEAARRAAAQGKLGKEVPLEDALIQKLPGWEQRATNKTYGRAMAAVTEEMQGKIARGELKNVDEALEYLSKKTNEVTRAIDRSGELATNQTLEEFGKPRTQPAYTGMGDKYSEYKQAAMDALASDPNAHNIVRTVVEDGIPLTGQAQIPGKGPFWEHTPPSSFPAIKEKMNGAWQRATAAKTKDELIGAVADLHWWGAQMMPFNRGSAGAMDAMTKALLNNGGVKPGAWRPGVAVDLEAFQMPRAEFARRYASFFEP